jgi:cell wall-associated NlpC family hydrolase
MPTSQPIVVAALVLALLSLAAGRAAAAPEHPSSPAPSPAAQAAGALAPAGAASAAPASGDAVLQLLQDKGLVPKPTPAAESRPATGTSPLVQQVRDAASDMVLAAMNFLGVPYKRGGSSAEQGFDCSGFTRHIFENSLGLLLPRRADQQAHDAGLANVKRDELRPGDLVFFNTMRRAFSHVGIYIGEGKFIHAPRTGGEVRIEDMRQAYWVKRYNGARRAEAPAATAATNAATANESSARR